MPIRGVQHDTDQIHGLSRNRRPGRRPTHHAKLWNLKHPPTPILKHDNLISLHTSAS